ncbi:MAG: Ldh family oxidoreductase [Treponema sp.]|jgi:L-2-hydroxycarboxylate dehydrogenase (NAD+)|nr:Ldh family oxidoreductase [Treponema sp.]
MMGQVKTIETVKNEIIRALTARGARDRDARIVADSLAFADARGTKSHGLNMLDAYLERIEKGGINVDAEIIKVRETESTLVLDGNGGFGQVGVSALIAQLTEKAGHHSIVCGSIKNINHCGALAYFTLPAAKNGLLAFLFANANPTVAPFGSMEAVLGTNPFSIAIPNGDHPIVLDMASSAVAKAKIYQAAREGKKIDPSWALDAEGNPTDDPQKAINGVLTAMGGAKGYGIALAVEVLAGVLSGGGIIGEVNSVHKNPQTGMNAGAFGILIDIKSFLDKEAYAERINKLTGKIRAAKPQPGKQIFLPGEIEEGNYNAALQHGVTY